ncbi:tRNA (adenosine(37)-N6)-dimethylallyltransferase MiaA [Kribbella sindirgiensis]|uniref:tRNA dimethylallyltransferase n=1 Tax=Kribbella sindirgiensis TaxID=1124744 RepID=A0A4R0IPH7_9ACTN|nr:tRNA (adenosine(37)-N6)-dimethylallyltransferase MiaA [Kribbella sindirgiensis]TCC34889.1 tRNA (adenosine(37)-N6)-dimethylallyltransferase MiaA [Kribbella sindirgiensis]
MHPTPVIAVVGTTASGKSDLAVSLAEALGGEIVNADSMQLYKGLNIGAAKITAGQMRGIRHHLLDVLDLDRPADVSWYQETAREVVDRLRAARRAAILVGGSGLYLRSVLDDLRFPPTSAPLRHRLNTELERVGSVGMHAQLLAAAPEVGARVPAGNGRRIVRALEVLALTGKGPATALPEPRYVYPAVQIGLSVPRDVLHRQIAARLYRMWNSGLVEEVRQLLDLGLRDNPTARQALGYAQIIRHLDGECTAEQAYRETLRRTKRFAKRQDTWLRRDSRINWLDHDRPDLAQAALAIVRQHSEDPPQDVA